MKFTTPFDWKHCDTHMQVGQTYEVHWPHSKLGACGTRWQYQEPFYDGVTCDLSKIEPDRVTDNAILSQHVGVQAQIFVIVNDKANDNDYYYPNLIGGMIVDGTAEPPFGTDMAIYTGSTTGTSRNNTECSAWGPITWQVDRKCHMISASSFDKMCADMKRMPDDMTKDLEAHGSREVVDEKLSIAQVTSPTASPIASTASPIASTASPTASPIALTESPTASPTAHTDTTDSTDTTESTTEHMPELTMELTTELTTTELTPEHTPELTLMAHTPMPVVLLHTLTVPLPPPRPPRSYPLSKLTLPPTASPLPFMQDTPMLLDTLMLPSNTPDSSLTPTEPLYPLNPQMSSLPVRNIWLPMLPLKRTN